MTRESHSDKGLKTIQLMGTKADQWTLTPIKWKTVLMMHPTKVKCDTCGGRGQVHMKDGKIAVNKVNYEKDYYGWQDRQREIRNYPLGRCTKCPQSPKYPMSGTGEVTVMAEQKVMVGIPVWAKDTVFDSRFHDEIYDGKRHEGEKNVHSVCDLCSKSIYGIWSFTVPIQAKGEDGRIHGMWVGQDCAKKILGIELLLTPEQKREMKKSEIKNWRVMEKLP